MKKASNALLRTYTFTNPYGVPYFAVEFHVPACSAPEYRGFPDSKKGRKKVAKYLRNMADRVEKVK